MRATPWVTESPSPETYFGSSISADVEASDSPDSAISELSHRVNLVSLPDISLASTDHPPLELLFGGQMVAPSWNDEQEHTVNNFIEDHPRETNLQLIVKWSPSSLAVDPRGQGGAETFKLLFDRLTRFVSVKNNPVCSAMAGFERINITVPESAEQAGVPGEHRAIDLRSAPNLREFSFTGSFLTLTENFTLTSIAHLTKLSLTGCRISVNDTLALLQSSSQLQAVEFETIYDNCEAGRRLTLNPGVGQKPPLDTMWITTRTAIFPILAWVDLPQRPAITLTVLANGACTADQNLLASIGEIDTINLKPFKVKGTFLKDTIATVPLEFPGVVIVDT